MKTSRRFLASTCFLLLPLLAASCSEELNQREMEVRVHGVYCDPDHAVLIAEGTNENTIDRFDDLRRTELYRTPDGRHYFVQNEDGYDMSVDLLSRINAMGLYNDLPDHRRDFTQAFAD